MELTKQGKQWGRMFEGLQCPAITLY